MFIQGEEADGKVLAADSDNNSDYDYIPNILRSGSRFCSTSYVNFGGDS